MLDIQFIRENSAIVKEAAKNKNVEVDINRLLELDEQRRQFQQQVEDLRRQRNELSAHTTNKPTSEQIEKGKRLKDDLNTLEKDFQKVEVQFHEILQNVPNVYSATTPLGKDESGNQVLRTWGEQTRFDFKPKPHWEIGSNLDIIDNERASKVSGARFTYLKGDGALLQFALLQFVLSIVTNEAIIKEIIKANNLGLKPSAFVPVIPPVLVRPEVMQRMARLEPKDDRFLTLGEEFVLVGSAEHSLGSMHMDEILDNDALPLRYIGYSSSFRREAGSYGQDTRGILRMHQFDKLEMESFSNAETGPDEHKLMVTLQEHIMQQLELPYQAVAICTGDMGAPDFQQTDIEAWIPAQGRYRETHTADYMTDYQARRLQTRYRSDGETKLVHMNDATAVAIGRTLIAILENYQTKEGKVRVPKVLQPFMNKGEI